MPRFTVLAKNPNDEQLAKDLELFINLKFPEDKEYRLKQILKYGRVDIQVHWTEDEINK